MKLYLASVYTSGISRHGTSYRKFTDREKLARDAIPHVLESYHYVHKQSAVDAMRRDGQKVFLDSGAFSAFTQGVEIDLPGYCSYIKRNADLILVASVLDGIGDPLKTYQNQKRMEDLGTRPLPCFHYGEDERYLEYYLQNYEYITLGGMVPIAKPQLRIWLDRIWSKYLTDEHGLPRIKVHGFGLTRVDLMQRYPWYSVDSSSWVQSANNGGIYIPDHGTIFISDDSPQAKDEGRHFNTISPMERQVLLQEIERRGFDPERLRKTYLARWTFNMVTFNEITDPNAPPKPFKLAQELLF